MVRTRATCMSVLGVVHVASFILWGVSILCHAGSLKAAEVLGDEEPAASTEQPVFRDTFDDNLKDTIWRYAADDPNNCVLKEVNQRLELAATGAGGDIGAWYVASGWRLDTRRDFSMRIDYHYDLMSYARGSLGFGVTPDIGDPWQRHAVMGVASASRFTHYWNREYDDGRAVNTNAAQRSASDGTLYMSYDAASDELRLSLGDSATSSVWEILPGLLKGKWGSRPVLVWLTGESNGLAIQSGHAYLNNLLVESGTVIEASLAEVHRFWSPAFERHFYTISEAEKAKLLAEYSGLWTYEGPAYRAFAENVDLDTRPVHRFWSDNFNSHYYTMDESEKNELLGGAGRLWAYEGVAFYAYPCGQQPSWTRPVYRFWFPAKETHFYTMSEAEREKVLAMDPSTRVDGGIAWYANE